MSETPLIAPETPDLVWFRGPDTVRFLNDLVSQEIADLEPGRVVRSFLLGPRGKMDHILWVLRGDPDVGLLTDPGRGDALAASLNRYRIRVDVVIEQPEEPAALVVGEWGPVGGTWHATETGLAADVSWETMKRTFVLGEVPEYGLMPEDDYERARIEAGEPRWGADVSEDTIPHESGLVPTAVDFTKGCFLGQELVARIDSRGGNVPRHLRLLDLGDATAEPGLMVESDGSEVGSVTSVSGSIAMATLKRSVGPGDEVRIGEALARVVR